MGILGALADGALNLGLDTAGGLINNIFYKKNAERQNNYNKELMQYQFDLQQKAIDAQNAYNSPASQMERLKEAGLNPNLVYGSVNTGNQSSAQKINAAAPANYQSIPSPTAKILERVNILDSFVKLQDSISKARESNARANLYDVQSLSQKWYQDNLAPLYKNKLSLLNTGLGYNNDIMKERASYAPLNESFRSIGLQYQSSAAYVDYVRKMKDLQNYDWYNERRKKSVDLELNKLRQSITNMTSQDAIMGLQKDAFELQNRFTRWYNRYRTDKRRNLYTPKFAPENYLDNLLAPFDDLNY